MKQPLNPSTQNTQQLATRLLPGQQAGSPNGYIAQLSAAVNQSPLVQSQLRLRDDMAQGYGERDGFSMPAHPVQARAASAFSPVPVAQMVLDISNVQEKAGIFLACHAEEAKLISQANTLLGNYSNDATDENFNLLNQALPGIRDKITEQTELQAGIMGEYAACATESVRKTFLDAVLAKDSSEIRPLLDQLMGQITLSDGVDEKFKHRFLASVLQSSKFATGAGRLKELMGLLGERKVVIDKLTYGGPKAGLADYDTDNPKSEKVNARDPAADARLLKASGGNLAEYIKAKRGTEAARVANPKKTEIRNVTVLMDSSQKL